MPSSTSVGPTSNRSDDDPRISPTKRTMRPRSSAGVGMTHLEVVELGYQALHRPAVVEQLAQEAGSAAADGAQQGAERGPRVGEQGRERQMRLEEQPCRGTQAAPLELLGHASRRIDPHVTLARRRASASPAAWVSDAFVVATTIDSGSGGAPSRVSSPSRISAASAALKTPCSVPTKENATRRSWSGSANARADRMAATRRSGSRIRSWPTPTAWMT